MDNDDSITIQVVPFYHSECIHVLVPPRYWRKNAIPEVVAQAIRETWEKNEDDDAAR